MKNVNKSIALILFNYLKSRADEDKQVAVKIWDMVTDLNLSEASAKNYRRYLIDKGYLIDTGIKSGRSGCLPVLKINKDFEV